MKHNTYNLNWLFNKVAKKDNIKYLLSLEKIRFKSIKRNIDLLGFGIQIEQGNSLEEQLQIESLERQARAEKQPRRKFELVQEINKLKEKLY